MPRSNRSRNRCALLAASLIGLLLTSVSYADISQGEQAYQAGDYRRALRLWTEEADQGDRRAQFLVSSLYLNGPGVKRDEKKGIDWLRRAADGGFPPAQFNLGNAYFHGNGVARNFTTATDWWRKAATSGFTQAQFNLGFAYLRGTGVPAMEQQAIRWFESAAEGGSDPARKILEEIRGRERPGGRFAAQPDRKVAAEPPLREPGSDIIPPPSVEQTPPRAQTDPRERMGYQAPQGAAVTRADRPDRSLIPRPTPSTIDTAPKAVKRPAAAAPQHLPRAAAPRIATTAPSPASPYRAYERVDISSHLLNSQNPHPAAIATERRRVTPPPMARPAPTLASRPPAPAPREQRSVQRAEAQARPAPPPPTSPPPQRRPPIEHMRGVPFGNRWYQSRPPTHYTIQVFGSSDRNEVIALARDLAENYPAGWFTSVVGGETLYSVTIGEYPDHASAEAAREKLPLERWNSPGWLRTFKRIQTIMVAR